MHPTGSQSEATARSTEPHKALLGWGRGLGADGAGCVPRRPLCLQLRAQGPVSAKDLTMGQHLFYQDLSEAWVGHGGEV